MENIPVGSISSASYEWSVTDKDSNGNYFPGKYDIAADLWFAPPSLADAPVPAPGDTEVMIWMDEHNQVPAGHFITSAAIDGSVYSLYCTQKFNNDSKYDGVYIAFYPAYSVAPTGNTNANINLKDFIDYLESLNNPSCNNLNANNSPLGSTWYLRQIPVGFEIWNGGVGLEVDSFSESVS